MKISLSKSLYAIIVADCQDNYPNEGCGLLVGRDSVVTQVIPCSNDWPEGENRDHRFTIDPLTMVKIDAEATRSGQMIVGTYHSHPDHPAEPSQFDLDAAWPIYFYLIAEVRSGKVADLRAWRLNEEKNCFNEVKIDITY